MSKLRAFENYCMGYFGVEKESCDGFRSAGLIGPMNDYYFILLQAALSSITTIYARIYGSLKFILSFINRSALTWINLSLV